MSVNEMDSRLYLPAQVRAIGDQAQRASLLEILRNERALDADVLEQHPPFFWRATISNNRLDAYWTTMLLSSLRNYASEAAAGVAFLPGHDHRHLPIGSSLTGELSEQGELTEVRADFYTLTGLRIGSVDTDGFIVSVKGGLTRDVSIGFFGGRWICQICQQDYWRGRCPHLAGMTYESEENGVVRQQLCTVGVDDAHLAEVSGVYDGATPGAMIEKVYEMARSGSIDADTVRHAQTLYRLDKATTERMLALPALQKRHAGVDTKAAGQTPREDQRMDERQFNRMKEILANAGAIPAESRDAMDEETALVELDKFAVRFQNLQARATDGDTYRNDLVTAALEEGVRAYGADKFDSDTYERTLRGLPLDAIKRMRDDWKAVGDARFPGGRSTTDGDASGDTEKVVELRAPASQYA